MTSENLSHFQVVIIGTGFSGLLCASYLKEAGVDDIRVFEMTPSVGGGWSHGGVGAYPGAACDVPSYAYLPFLDRTGVIPSKKYVNQGEIADYAELLTDFIGMRDNIAFSRKVVAIDYIGEGDQVWRVTTEDPNTGATADIVTCQHVVAANGPLSSPRMPEVDGMSAFMGESFHTAMWDQSASLAGKKVGVIGTGASAAQVITSIVDEVAHLTVFQRTPTWCLPRMDEPTPPDIRAKFEAGGYSESLRVTDWRGDNPPDEPPLFEFDDLHDEQKNAGICAALAAQIQKDVEDPELVKLLTPDYPFFCKRALFIDDYYTTYNKPNVTLINDPGGVVRITEDGVELANGDTHGDLDVLIYATGFDSNFIPFAVTGRGGVTLADRFGANEANRWQMTRPHSLWGIHVSDMPNFYMMIGPQAINPVTNVTLVCEEQAKYVANLVSQITQSNHTEVEPTTEAVEKWTDICDKSADGKVWLKCNNWYLKTTKSATAAGRERSAGMYMHSYVDYLKQILGHEGGTPDELLSFR